MSKHRKTDLDFARDEMFAHIHRCGVLKATADQQESWIEDTLTYLVERFPGLSNEDQLELREMATRFCQPVIPHGKNHTALTTDEGAEATEEVVAEGAEVSQEDVAAAV